MTKKYRLLQPLPNVNAGETGVYYFNEYRFADNEGGYAYIKKAVVENNPDWFEPVPETPERITVNDVGFRRITFKPGMPLYEFLLSKEIPTTLYGKIGRAIEKCINDEANVFWTDELVQKCIKYSLRMAITLENVGRMEDIKMFKKTNGFNADEGEGFVWADEHVKNIIGDVQGHWVGSRKSVNDYIEKFKKSKSLSQKEGDGLSFMKMDEVGKTAAATKQDWEIVTWADGVTGNTMVQIYGDIEGNLKAGHKIRSVRRLSDGIVFTVGDEVCSMASSGNYIISKFLPKKGGMMADLSGHGCVFLQYLTKKTTSQPKEEKPVLFTTEDGVGYRGESIQMWYIRPGSWEAIEIHAPNFWCQETSYGSAEKANRKWKPGTATFNKWFSTEQAAQDYITLNKPQHTLKEIQEAWKAARETADGIAWDQWRPLKYKSLEEFLNTKK